MTEMDKMRQAKYWVVAKSFLCILLVIYMPGLLLGLIFQEMFENYYAPIDYSYFLLIFFILLFGVSFFLFSMVNGVLPYIKIPHFSKRISWVLISVVAAVFFVSAIHFNLSYSSKFRHVNRLSNADVIVSMLWSVKPLVSVIVMSLIIHACNGGTFNKRSKILLWTLFGGFILSITSSLQVIVPFLIFILIFKPNIFRQPIRSFGTAKLMLLIPAVFLVGVLVLLFGVGSKLGYDKVFSLGGVAVVNGYMNVIIPRVSTSFVSLMAMIELNWLQASFSYSSFESIVFTALNRFYAIISPKLFNGEAIDTVSRYNYLTVFLNHAARAGGSPGLLASVFYFPFYPLGFIAIPIYLVFIIRCVCSLANTSFYMGGIALMSVPYMVFNLFEAPINIMHILDPMFILFVFMLFFCKFVDIGKTYS